MRAICVASGKGGTSKTTLVASLGAWLAKDGDKVAIVDLNLDQASLTNWWIQRGRPTFPFLVDLTNFADDVEALRRTKWKVCLIDTPPDEMDVIESAILEADAVVIPVRASDLDIQACKAIVDLCERRRKPYGLLLVQIDTRAPYRKINDAARAQLTGIGRVLSPVFTANRAYSASVVDPTLRGKAGFEVDASLEQEIADIWEAIETIGRGQELEGLQDLFEDTTSRARRKRK